MFFLLFFARKHRQIALGKTARKEVRRNLIPRDR